MHPWLHNYPIDNSDPLYNSGNINTVRLSVEWSGRFPDKVACIVVLFGSIARGPFCKISLFWRYFMYADFKYVFDAPELAFIMSVLL